MKQLLRIGLIGWILIFSFKNRLFAQCDKSFRGMPDESVDNRFEPAGTDS